MCQVCFAVFVAPTAVFVALALLEPRSTVASNMMPEHRATRIAHRILSPQSSWEQFERTRVSQQRPGWNQAVGLIADAIREAVQAVKQCPSYTRCTAPGADAEWATPA
jgi:hypothetical protein